MESILAVTGNKVSMTSREIAELTGKRHDHVLRDIDGLVSTLPPELGNGFKSSTYLSGDPPREYRQFELDRDSAYCLVAGYDATSRMKIIKRWQALEAQATPQLELRPRQLANQILEDELQTAGLLGVPLHLAQLEAVKTVHRETGLSCQENLSKRKVLLAA